MKEGILNFYKPLELSSFDAVYKVRQILGIEKAGHLGTLDPMAEGILPIALNSSTRIIQFLSGWTKDYLVEMRLGIETDTQDATGTVIFQKSASEIKDKDVENKLIKSMKILMDKNDAPNEAYTRLGI